MITDIAKQARLSLLKMHFDAGVGHIGGNLSCIDILCALFHTVLTPNDSFLLSKGHAAGALYVVLASKNLIAKDDLKTFHQDGTVLAGHPPSKGIPEIPFATGSLGHGLPLSAGMALARKLRKKSGKVYCLMSDGEWNEGSNWEALIFATHRKLNNLVIIIDLNGMQGMGKTQDVANLDPLKSKFESFDCNVTEIDAHNLDELSSSLSNTQSTRGPQIYLAKSVKGKGVSFMENKFEWHYWPMNADQYQQAVKEVSNT